MSEISTLDWKESRRKKIKKEDLCILLYHGKEQQKHWASKELLKRDLSNFELLIIIATALDFEDRQEAWRRLVRQNPSEGELFLVIDFAPTEFKISAIRLLKKRLEKLSAYELLKVIHHSDLPLKYRVDFIAQLAKRGFKHVSNYDLLVMMGLKISPEIKAKIAKEIKARGLENLSNYELLILVCSEIPIQIKNEAAKQLLKRRELTNYELCLLIFHGAKYQHRAFNRLLKQRPANSDLRWIIGHAPEPIKKLAWEKFLKTNPDEYELRLVTQLPFIPRKYRSLAKKLLSKKPRS